MGDDPVASPFGGAQNGSMMSLPDSQGSFGLDLPVDNPAVSIARQQTSIPTKKAEAMDWCDMATQDIAGLGGWTGGGLARNGHV